MSNEREIPREVEQLLEGWKRLFDRASWANGIVGVVGVAAAAASAIVDGLWAKVLAGLSGVCIAVLGFLRLDEMYRKFARAWRALNIAAMRYRFGQIELTDLVDAVDISERMITQQESAPHPDIPRHGPLPGSGVPQVRT